MRKKRKSENKKLNIVAYLTQAMNVITLILMFAKNRNPEAGVPGVKKIILISFIAGLYVCSLLLTIILFVTDKNEKFKQLFLLISVPVLVAPLLIVNPITARCYYPPYFIMAMLLVAMFDYIARECKEDFDKAEFVVSPVMLIASAFLCTMFISVYSTIDSYSRLSKEYIKKQVANDEDVVYVISFPNKDYLWGSEVASAAWKSRYKTYFGIDQKSEVVYLPQKEFDEFVSNYK